MNPTTVVIYSAMIWQGDTRSFDLGVIYLSLCYCFYEITWLELKLLLKLGLKKAEICQRGTTCTYKQ